jgi:hypothetical protein
MLPQTPGVEGLRLRTVLRNVREAYAINKTVLELDCVMTELDRIAERWYGMIARSRESLLEPRRSREQWESEPKRHETHQV